MDEECVVSRGWRAGSLTVLPHIRPCHAVFMNTVRGREVEEKTRV